MAFWQRKRDAVAPQVRTEPTLSVAPESAKASAPFLRRAPIVGVRSGSGIAAGTQSTLFASWTGADQAIDELLRRFLPMTRARSREQYLNGDIGKRYIGLLKSNVIGPNGIVLQARVKDAAGRADKDASDAVEAAWREWLCEGYAEITGGYRGKSLLETCLAAAALDGEVLLKKVTGRDAGPFRYAVQFIDPRRLDVNHNRKLSSGNEIRLGVECSAAGRPVAYWLRTQSHARYDYMNSSGVAYERIAADEVIHLYVRDVPGQTRGLPWMHASLVRMYNLTGYEDAAITAMRAGASKMGMYVSPDGDPSQFASGNDAGEFIEELSPGVIGVAPQGYNFVPFDAGYPAGEFGPFMKTGLRGVASGLNTSYHLLASDLESVNFSSAQVGVSEDREGWKSIQGWLIDNLLEILAGEWLWYALLTGRVRGKRVYDVSDYDRLRAFGWQARRWTAVDPRKDADANKTSIDERLKSRGDVIREQGRDPQEVWEEIARENEILAQLGIRPTEGKSGVSAEQEAGQQAAEDE